MFLTAVRHEVSSLDKTVVVHELELAMKRALSGRLCSLGNQYNVGSLSCLSLILTAHLAVKLIEWVLTIDRLPAENRSYVLVLPSFCIIVLIK